MFIHMFLDKTMMVDIYKPNGITIKDPVHSSGLMMH